VVLGEGLAIRGGSSGVGFLQTDLPGNKGRFWLAARFGRDKAKSMDVQLYVWIRVAPPGGIGRRDEEVRGEKGIKQDVMREATWVSHCHVVRAWLLRGVNWYWGAAQGSRFCGFSCH